MHTRLSSPVIVAALVGPAIVACNGSLLGASTPPDDASSVARDRDGGVAHDRDGAVDREGDGAVSRDRDGGGTPPPPPPPPVGELRQIITTGSIAAGSSELTIPGDHEGGDFHVGDWVIVEIGREPGAGLRGTVGVGGTWPARSYASESELTGDTSLENRTFAWAEDTGYVFWWLDGLWYNIAPDRENTFYTGSYYLGRAIPRSLQTRIVAIDGTTLTLDRSAHVSVEGANVYLDTAPILTAMIAAGGALELPAARYPVGGIVWIRDQTGFTLAGAGRDATTIFSPMGVPSAGIQAWSAPGTTIRDLTLEGNFRDQGFGMNWTGSTDAGTYEPVTETDVPQGGAFPRGVFFGNGSHRGVARDLRVIDVSQQAIGISFSNDTWAYRVENVQHDLLRQYVQWQFQWADADGGGCEDCSVQSTWLISGFEAFKSNRISFIRTTGTNAMFAMNGAGGWLIDGGEIRFTVGCLHPESDRFAASAAHALVNVNTNIGVHGAGAGGTLRGLTLVQEGYVDGESIVLQGVIVNDLNPNVVIDGLHYTAPDYVVGSISGGAVGINSTGENNLIQNTTIVGRARNEANAWNIFALHGVNGGGNVAEGISGL
jgi:hypothetical protein